MKKLLNIKVLFNSMTLSFLLFVGYKIFGFTDLNLSNILIYISLVTIFTLLSFLAYYDFLKMEVHNIVSFILMISLLLINIFFYLYKGPEVGIEITNGYTYLPLFNFYAAIILGSIFLFIVLISKEKALGQGDVRVAIIVGLLIGYSNILTWIYITLLTAICYALLLGIKRGKLKGLQIPFVPFMILGSLIVVLLSL
ncbi:MAG: prepilin peptidase [Candidatus Dojkabacteria bacterium]